MNNSTNAWFLLGAAVVGLVSAAGVYLIEQFRHDKRKHAFNQDVARLDNQLSSLRKELEVLRALQKEKLSSVTSKPNRRRLRNSTALSVASTEDYNSALDVDSSDLEFYDLSSEEDVSTNSVSLEKEFEVIDQLLEDESKYEEALGKLESLNRRYQDNPEILWRLGKALKTKSNLTEDSEERKEVISRGISVCEHACDLAPTNADCHKWFAILVGLRGELQSTKDRILDGNLFFEHIQKALEITPNDPLLHHLLGRFTIEVANLSWIERALASSLFAELPQCTHQGALNCFLKAEKLSENEWKENRLFIAKCEIAMGKLSEAVQWLNKAEMAQSEEEEKVHEEVRDLLQKYGKQ